jgi:resuscitation-promoting factor RpfA
VATVRRAGTVRQQRRWHLTDFQRFLVVLVVVTAMFLSAMALGGSNLILLLVAVFLLVAAGLGVFLLGVRYNSRGVIQGNGHVISAPPPPLGQIIGRCDLRLLVDFPDQPSVTIKLRDPQVPVMKWPRVGNVLPVEAPVRNPRQVRVRWESVGAHAQPQRQSSPMETPYSGPTYGSFDVGPIDVGPDVGYDIGGVDVGPAYADYEDVESAFGDTDPVDADYPEPDGRPARADTTTPDDGMMLVDLDAETLVRVPRPKEHRPATPAEPANAGPPATPGEPANAAQPADPLAEASALAAQFELPVRGIPRPRTDGSVPAVAAPSAPDPLAAEVAALMAMPSDIAPLAETPPPKPAGDGRAMGVMLIVSDLTRSVAFYRELPGVTVVDHTSGSAVLSYGGGRILLRQVADMSPVDRRVVHLHIEVADVEETYQGLKAKGIEFVHRPRVMSRGDRLEVSAATFRDPDGHAIALTHWRTRTDLAPPANTPSADLAPGVD